MNNYMSNLLFLCERKGISITEFENIIYIPKVRIMEPTPEELLRISDFFDLPIDVLIKKDLTAYHRSNNKEIKLVILDVDGTLTDGGMYFFEDGNQMKKYNSKDGLAIMALIKNGIEFGIISHGRKLKMVQDRADLLGIQRVYVGTDSKVQVLEGWLKEMNITKDQVAFVGDDKNDLEIINYVGFSACPSDALPEVKSACDVILEKAGGRGCVREFIDNWLN